MPRPMAVIGITLYFVLTALFIINKTTVAVAALVVAIICFAVCMALKGVRGRVVIPAACLSIAAACVLFVTENEFHIKYVKAKAGDGLKVEAVMTDYPSAQNGKYEYPLKTTSINGEKVKTNIRLRWDKKLSAEPYDKVIMTLGLYKTEATGSSALYGISENMLLYVDNCDEIRTEKTEKKPIGYFIVKLRRYIKDSVFDFLPKDMGGLALGMLLGEKEYIPPSIRRNFNICGISHLFAVSGFHLSIFALSVFEILKRLRLNRRSASLITMFFVVFFTALTGFSVSCVRAAVMMLTMLLGIVVSRQADPLNSLGLAVLLICLFEPSNAASVGLMLSVAATLGIFILARPLDGFLKRRIKTLPKGLRAPLYAVGGIFAMSVGASVFTMPIAALLFGRVSPSAPLANIMMMSAASFAVISGAFIPVFAGTGFFSFFSKIAALASGVALKYLVWISEKIASLPFASVNADEKYIKLCMVFALVIFAAALLLAGFNKRLTAFAAGLSAIVFAAGMLSYGIFCGGVTKITVFDVGNGSSVVVSNGDRAAVIGCGGNNTATYKIENKLDSLGVKSIEFMLLPRPLGTETSAAHEVLSEFKADKVVIPERDEELSHISLLCEPVYSGNVSSKLWQNAEIKYVGDPSGGAAYLDIDGTTVLFTFGPGSDVKNIPPSFLSADILYCRQKPPEGLEAEKFGLVVISGDEKSEEAASAINSKGGRAYSVSLFGDTVITTSGSSVCKIDTEYSLKLVNA
ncbi:MAG: ComEC/Rec2 family competence protein [Clostridiales bacterium]|nr:ComEC/Rec2 family competence protein [Clostridiales bacterium]